VNRQKILSILAKFYNQKRKIDKEAMCRIMTNLYLSLKKAKNVLDLGAGSGRILLPLAALYSEVSFEAVDDSELMLAELEKQVKLGGHLNIQTHKLNFNLPDWTGNLFKKQFDAIIIFQGIHFVLDMNRFLKDVTGLVAKNGKIVIASTNHDQFFRLPYCLNFPDVLKKELDRTPDELQLVELMLKEGWGVKSRVEVEVKSRFESKECLRDWLLLKPFSALSYISDEEFDQGVEKYLTQEWKKTKNYKVDEFVLLTFGREAE